jgi:hypothetical protein
MPETNLIPAERVEHAILLIRGHKVLLDEDLAALYGVATKRLNEQVKRNVERFPPDFMFQLTFEETHHLRSQNATSRSWGGSRRGRPPLGARRAAAARATVRSRCA